MSHRTLVGPINGHGGSNGHGNGSGNGHGNGIDHAAETYLEQSAIDSDIAARVKAALGALPGQMHLQVGVDTESAVVTLTRWVDTRAQTEAAVYAASQVQGVKHVNDHLVARLKPSTHKFASRTNKGPGAAPR